VDVDRRRPQPLRQLVKEHEQDVDNERREHHAVKRRGQPVLGIEERRDVDGRQDDGDQDRPDHDHQVELVFEIVHEKRNPGNSLCFQG